MKVEFKKHWVNHEPKDIAPSIGRAKEIILMAWWTTSTNLTKAEFLELSEIKPVKELYEVVSAVSGGYKGETSITHVEAWTKKSAIEIEEALGARVLRAHKL